MTCNIGNRERVARVVLGLALLALGWTGLAGGTLGLVLKVLGFVPVITGLTGFCPAYLPFGFSTRRT